MPEFFGTFFAVNIDIFLHHPAVGAEYAENAVAGIFDAVAVAYAYCPVDTAVLLARVIVDRAVERPPLGMIMALLSPVVIMVWNIWIS